MRWRIPTGIVCCPVCILPNVYSCLSLSAPCSLVLLRLKSDKNTNHIQILIKSQDCSPLQKQRPARHLSIILSLIFCILLSIFHNKLFSSVMINIVIPYCHFLDFLSQHFYKISIAPLNHHIIQYVKNYLPFSVAVKMTSKSRELLWNLFNIVLEGK